MRVSVLMGVYNAEATLAESIRSILGQSFGDWEFIICDDGSTDATAKILGKFGEVDERIKVVTNDRNRGLTYSLNRALEMVEGEYVARQDADDRSCRDRLRDQVKFLDEHPECAVVSNAISLFDELGEWGKVEYPRRPTKKDFLRGSPFCHGSSMTRSEVMKELGGYRDLVRTMRVEDYDLWFRLYRAGHLGANLTGVLYEVRDDRDAMRRRRFRYRVNEAWVRVEGSFALGMPWSGLAFSLRPLLIGLLPSGMYSGLRRRFRSDSDSTP